MPNQEVELNKKIANDYEVNGLKLDLEVFLSVVRVSRKFGFPFVCTLTNKTPEERLAWAAKLLIDVAQSYPISELPDDFKVEVGTKLHDDAMQLLAATMANSIELSKMACFPKTDLSELDSLSKEEGEALSANFNSKFNMS